MIKTPLIPLAAAAAALLMLASAQAAPVVYFAENQTPAGGVGPPPLNARNAFLSTLTGVSIEGFEGFALGSTQPLTLSFAGSTGILTALLSGGSGVVSGTGTAGRFNTTPGGNRWFDVASSFAIDFSTPISAFGFYGTDIGDFNGQVTAALTDINDVVTTLNIGNTVNGNNASLLFWGFTDAANSYKRITFGNTAAGDDFFGFDDMIIGDRLQVVDPDPNPNPIPEPGSLALVGLSLAGLAAMRRRKANKR
jgi:hypothetical protein